MSVHPHHKTCTRHTPTLCMLCSLLPNTPCFAILSSSSPMETLQPLSIESFSYRWLISIKPSSFDSPDDASDLSPFIDIDPKLVSLRMAAAEAHDFTFGLSASQQPQGLTDADEIICDGFLLPLQVAAHRGDEGKENNNSNNKSNSPDSVLSRSLSVDSSRVLLSLSKRHRIQEYSCGFPNRPISQGSSPMLPRPSPALSRGRSSRKDGGLKLDFVFGNCGRSSKRILKKYLCFLMPLYKKVKDLRSGSSGLRKRGDCGGGFSSSDWCRPTKASFDAGVEKSIHEAVLHCKKSIGRDE